MLIITTYKCNLACAHCCYSCSPKRTEFMTDDVFDKIIFNSDEDTIRICGGELFMHPNWIYHISNLGKFKNIEIITNGTLFFKKNKENSDTLNILLNILKTFKEQNIEIRISNDEFHRAEMQSKGYWQPEEVYEMMVNLSLPTNIRINCPLRTEIAPAGNAYINKVHNSSHKCKFALLETLKKVNFDPQGDAYICMNLVGKIGDYTENHSLIKKRFIDMKKSDNCETCEYLKESRHEKN